MISCQKSEGPKKVGFAPQKRNLVVDLLSLLVREASLHAQHVENGVCRKIILEKKFIVVHVEQSLDFNRNSNMSHSLRL